MSTRANNLTEIDEDDFIYQGPSPYATVVDFNSLTEKKDEEKSIEQSSSQPSYRIDEDIDEDEHDERDHVKELEETIANLSRHFPLASSSPSPSQIDPLEQPSSTGNKMISNLASTGNLSSNKIDIDSILEMEIESPSREECFIQPTSGMSLAQSLSLQHPLHIPISVPISIPNRRGSLSRSSGVRENLTNLLMTTGDASIASDHRPLQRTASTYTKVNAFFLFF